MNQGRSLQMLEPSPDTVCCRPLDAPRMSTDEAVATAAMFSALADPARVKIVNALATSDRAACVCELTPALGLSQPTVSHHLKKLTESGLLTREQRGRWAYYALDPAAIALLGSLTTFTEGSP